MKEIFEDNDYEEVAQEMLGEPSKEVQCVPGIRREKGEGVSESTP